MRVKELLKYVRVCRSYHKKTARVSFLARGVYRVVHKSNLTNFITSFHKNSVTINDGFKLCDEIKYFIMVYFFDHSVATSLPVSSV